MPTRKGVPWGQPPYDLKMSPRPGGKSGAFIMDKETALKASGLTSRIESVKWSLDYVESKIEKYLISIGYKRELISTASVGTNHTYGYKRQKDDGWNDIIRDYELSGMSLKQVKQKYT